jgi:protein disulfide-isomerase A1
MKKVGMHTKTLTSMDDLSDFIALQGSKFVLGLFQGFDSPHVMKFNRVAERNSKYPFALSVSPEVLEHYNVDEDSIVLIKDFEDGRSDLVLTPSMKTGDIEKFVNGHMTPLVQRFSDETAPYILSNPIQMQAVYFTNMSSSYHESFIESMTPLAEKYRGRLIFFYVSSKEKLALHFFGLTRRDLPKIVLTNSVGGAVLRYPYKGDLYNQDEIEQFIELFLQGKAERGFKSERIHADDMANPLKVVRGKSFEDVVINNNQNVFLALVAPQCKPCRTLGKKCHCIRNRS